MIIFGLIEIKWLGKKQKVLDEYARNGYISAVIMYKKLYKSTLSKARNTVKKWIVEPRR